MSYPRLLSIQSHVSSGRVGQKCAVFPLSLLGYEVDEINTVNYSTHTGHQGWKGHKTTPEQINMLLVALQSHTMWDKILTGYIPDKK